MKEFYINNVIYLVTGAAGHLGSVIISKLLKKGAVVRGFIRPSEAALMPSPPKGLTYVTGDICRRETLEPLFALPEKDSSAPSSSFNGFILIHCAGLISIYGRSDKNVQRVNVEGAKNVTDACIRHHVLRMIYVSSVHAIPELSKGSIIHEISHFIPKQIVGCYARTKAEATQYVLDSVKKGLNAVIVHPSGIIGPGSRLTGSLMHMIAGYAKNGMPLAVKGGYDFVDVRDVADGIIAAILYGRSGECYILSNRYVELTELFRELSALSGHKPPRLYLPMWLAKAAAPFAQLHYKCWKKTPVFTPYALYTLSSNGKFSHEKADRELGYHPRPLHETLEDTVKEIF